MSDELAVYEGQGQDIMTQRPPDVVLAEAQKAARALADVVSKKKKPVMMNGEQYLEFEDWQTVGRFYGVTAKVIRTNPIEMSGVMGFEAYAVAIRTDGMEISAAEAMCMNDEPNWKSKPLFQLRSMAQTRACSKVLRQVLAWVVVLAGYRATPAEEIQDMAGASKAPITPPQSKTATAPAAKVDSNTVTGIVEVVSVKTGKSAKGPYTKFGIKIGDEWYGTFDSKIGATAESLKGIEVHLTWKQDGNYKTCEGIVPAWETVNTASTDPEGCTKIPVDCPNSYTTDTAGEYICGEAGPACKYAQGNTEL